MYAPRPTLRERFDALSDARALAVVAMGLFLLSAWPLLLVRIPPLQDLPNHLATAVALARPADYPEYVSNGFLKTNSSLFLWLHFLGPRVGLPLAAKLFVALVLGAGALAYPWTVLSLRGRDRLPGASLFLWPMVHNWFVCAGMLDYALGVPLSLVLLVTLHRNRASPSLARSVTAALLAMAVWYTHAFALLVAGLLVVIEQARAIVTDRKAGVRQALLLGVPLLPATALVAWSIALQAGEPKVGDPGWGFRPVWELLYNAWAEWLWGFSKSSISSIVAAFALAVFAWRGRREAVPMFSPIAMLVLALAFCFMPYRADNWFFVNSRFLPFFWVAASLRAPASPPAWLVRLGAACAALWSIGMGVDYTRLSRSWDEFAKGESAVPEHATVLPLVFDRKGPHGENTWPMLHAWGLYVLDRHVHSPLVFSHSRSFPLSARQPPPLRFHQMYLEPLPDVLSSPEAYCETVEKRGVVPDDCTAQFEAAWREFWQDAAPRYDHALLWGTPKAVRDRLPASYRVAFEDGELIVLERR